jgi:hypothetical protein
MYDDDLKKKKQGSKKNQKFCRFKNSSIQWLTIFLPKKEPTFYFFLN